MLDFQQKRKVRGVIYHPVTLGILAILCLFAIHSTWAVYRKKTVSEESKNSSLKHVENLRERDAELVYKMERLKTEQGIEEEIRSKFSVAKEDENVVIVVQDEAAPLPPEQISLWGRIKKLLGL